MSELTRTDIRDGFFSMLQKVEKSIVDMRAGEARGMARLEKSLSKSTPIAAGPRCKGCGGQQLETIGSHSGSDHYLCKGCGETGSNASMAKADSTVQSVQQAVGVTGGGPKGPSVKKPSVSVSTATSPQKDAFNTGGAPMNKEALPMQDVDTEDGKPRPGTKLPEAGKIVPAPGSGELRKDFGDMDRKAAAVQNAPTPVQAPAPVAPENRYNPTGSIALANGRETPAVTARDKVNMKIAATQGVARAMSVATVRQRANASINNTVQGAKRAAFFQNQTAAAQPPVAKNEVPPDIQKAEGRLEAPKAPRAPGAAETPAPAVPTVKNPNVTPTGTPKL